LCLLCSVAAAAACGPQEKNIKHTGNITMDDIIEIARVMRPRSCAKYLAGTCKEMLGTAQSVGCTVDHEHPQKIMEKVRGAGEGGAQGRGARAGGAGMIKGRVARVNVGKHDKLPHGCGGEWELSSAISCFVAAGALLWG
jgi:hypothetical protein